MLVGLGVGRQFLVGIGRSHHSKGIEGGGIKGDHGYSQQDKPQLRQRKRLEDGHDSLI